MDEPDGSKRGRAAKFTIAVDCRCKDESGKFRAGGYQNDGEENDTYTGVVIEECRFIGILQGTKEGGKKNEER